MALPQSERHWRRPSRKMLRVVALLAVAGIAAALLASRPTSDPEALAAQSRAFFKDFRYEDALRTAQDALDLVSGGGYPPEYVAKFHLLRGQMWHAVYEWDFALSDFDRAIELAPDYPEAYYLRGVFFTNLSAGGGVEQLELALADFRQAVELDPDGAYAADARTAIQTIERQQAALSGP